MKNYIYLKEKNFLKTNEFIYFLSGIGNWILIFTNFVPISLLVTIEVVKFIQAKFIMWDIKLYDKENNLPANVQSSTLNEELGQVKVI